MALGLRKMIGEDNYELVIDAIEAKNLKSLPDELREPARRSRFPRSWLTRTRRRRRSVRHAGRRPARSVTLSARCRSRTFTRAALRCCLGT
jgi:hypothetical protein